MWNMDRRQTPTWTIDELALRAALTVRTVRAHQSAGLLPPPEVRGRVGWYGAEHLRRLEAIGRLQRRGFSLAAIRELLQAWDDGRTLGEVLGLGRAAAPVRGAGGQPTVDQWLDGLFTMRRRGARTRPLDAGDLLPQPVWN